MVFHLVYEIPAEKQNEIQQRRKYRKCGCKVKEEEMEEKQCRHHYSDRYAYPFHFYRDKEVEIKLFVWIKHCIGKEKADIQIIIVRISDKKARDDIKQCAHEIINCEFKCTPCPLERHSDHVEQKKGKNHSDKALEIGDKKEGYHSPDLPVKDRRSVEAQHRGQVQVAEAKVSDKDHQHRSDNVEDKVIYPEFSVFIFKFVQKLVQFYDLLLFGI